MVSASQGEQVVPWASSPSVSWECAGCAASLIPEDCTTAAPGAPASRNTHAKTQAEVKRPALSGRMGLTLIAP